MHLPTQFNDLGLAVALTFAVVVDLTDNTTSTITTPFPETSTSPTSMIPIVVTRTFSTETATRSENTTAASSDTTIVRMMEREVTETVPSPTTSTTALPTPSAAAPVKLCWETDADAFDFQMHHESPIPYNRPIDPYQASRFWINRRVVPSKDDQKLVKGPGVRKGPFSLRFDLAEEDDCHNSRWGKLKIPKNSRFNGCNFVYKEDCDHWKLRFNLTGCVRESDGAIVGGTIVGVDYDFQDCTKPLENAGGYIDS